MWEGGRKGRGREGERGRKGGEEGEREGLLGELRRRWKRGEMEGRREGLLGWVGGGKEEETKGEKKGRVMGEREEEGREGPHPRHVIPPPPPFPGDQWEVVYSQMPHNVIHNWPPKIHWLSETPHPFP